MQIKATRHEKMALKELEKIADDNKIMSEENITVDAVIRTACYKLIIENRIHPIRITKEIIKELEYKARALCEK